MGFFTIRASEFLRRLKLRLDEIPEECPPLAATPTIVSFASYLILTLLLIHHVPSSQLQRITLILLLSASISLIAVSAPAAACTRAMDDYQFLRNMGGVWNAIKKSLESSLLIALIGIISSLFLSYIGFITLEEAVFSGLISAGTSIGVFPLTLFWGLRKFKTLAPALIITHASAILLAWYTISLLGWLFATASWAICHIAYALILTYSMKYSEPSAEGESLIGIIMRYTMPSAYNLLYCYLLFQDKILHVTLGGLSLHKVTNNLFIPMIPFIVGSIAASCVTSGIEVKGYHDGTLSQIREKSQKIKLKLYLSYLTQIASTIITIAILQILEVKEIYLAVAWGIFGIIILNLSILNLFNRWKISVEFLIFFSVTLSFISLISIKLADLNILSNLFLLLSIGGLIPSTIKGKSLIAGMPHSMFEYHIENAIKRIEAERGLEEA